MYIFPCKVTYEFHIFISRLLHPRVYYEFTTDQLPVGLIAQLVRALHWYRRGHGFDSRSSLNFFQACFSQLLKLSTLLRRSFICLKCISAVQIYEFHIFISYLLHPRVYYELTIDQLPVGLIAQLVRALHRYRRGHGFESRSSLNFFFRLAFLNCLT